MPNDIENLVKYQELIMEINELNKEFDSFDHYETVNLALSPDATVTITLENKTGKLSESKRITVSTLETFVEKARKNRDYRLRKLKEKNAQNVTK